MATIKRGRAGGGVNHRLQNVAGVSLSGGGGGGRASLSSCPAKRKSQEE